MPTQRLKEKRVEERTGERERERERERKNACTWVRKREKKCFGSSFYMFFLHLGLPYSNWA